MNSSPENRMSRRVIWILVGITLLSVGTYLLYSAAYHSVGFPLDDAWIHQTFARNLAFSGEWSFQAGQPSGGSTSPLWSALLAIGFWLKLAPYAWSYLLGALCLGGLGILAEKTLRSMVASYHPGFPWVGTILLLEWHLAWAAGSGMETLLYALLVTAVLALILLKSRRYFGIGVLVGLSVWVRPDGVSLLGAVVLGILLHERSWSQRLKGLTGLGVSAGSLIAIYLFFNLAVSGAPLPNTFYAKQAEYAVYLQLPFLQRLAAEGLQPLIGVGMVLLPGLVMAILSAVRRRDWGVLIAGTWLVGFLGLYAWRLPVTYQHGRYIMPAIPIYLLLGLVGSMEFLIKQAAGWQWTLSTFWKLAAAVVLVLFWGRGASAYAQDVAVIDTEMVDTAKWVAINIPGPEIVAAHDIGAMGYFGEHTLVDLAGLVSPDVIPFLRDETRLSAYLDEQGVSFLVAFPDWYPHLTSNLKQVYSSGAPYSRSLGQQNMAVYQWPAH